MKKYLDSCEVTAIQFLFQKRNIPNVVVIKKNTALFIIMIVFVESILTPCLPEERAVMFFLNSPLSLLYDTRYGF